MYTKINQEGEIGMLFQMLKKDILKRRGINFILFLFITLATVFLSSSVSNIVTVSSAVDHYMEYAKVPDVNVVTNTEKEKEKINTWLVKQKDKGSITTYDSTNLLVLSEKSIQIQKHNKWTDIDKNSISLYIGKMDVDYNKVYDQSGNSFEIGPGEIALSNFLMEKNKLSIGDSICLQVGNRKKIFTISQKMKDAAFGNEMAGMSRLIINKEDYKLLESDFDKMGLYYVNTNDIVKFNQQINNQNFDSIMSVLTIDVYKMVYTFDMILAALLILIGVCLILIALLVLRFNLIFTMEEQYQEIGILKAIGFRNLSIKNIYLVKYLFIVLVGSLLGLLLSIPVSNIMIEAVSKNIIMESGTNLLINLICAIFIVILVLLFCYFCTRKLNKVSAITAIRNGETGESFGKKKGISLSKRKYMKVPFYLGLNDILSHIRRYAVLIITFAISFVLLTIPLNTLNTMGSKEMMKKFSLNPNSSVYLSSIEQKGTEKYASKKQLEEGITRVKKELLEKGYKTEMSAGLIYFLKYASLGSNQHKNLMTIQLMGENINYAEYSEGTAPVLSNEIAFSKPVLKENGWSIGDYVTVKIGGKVEKLLITGTYSDYMQLGRSARVNPILDCSQDILFDYWNIMVNIDTEKSQEELATLLEKQFPDYEWRTGPEVVDQNVGSIKEALASLLFPMTAMLCAIIMLITLLMEKLFIAREKGETAMLKSIGFRYSSVRNWQVIRMVLVALTSMVVAVPLSLLSNQFMLKPIFAIMGADVAIQVDLLKVYILYPGILLVAILLATLVAARGVRKIHIRELNNLE